MTESSSQAETTSLVAEEAPQNPKKYRFLAFLGFLIFAFCIAGFSFDLFEMGRFFWGVAFVWLLIVRLIIVIKRPDLLAKSPEQSNSSARVEL